MVSSMFYTPSTETANTLSTETEQNDILLTWWSPACSQSPGCPPGWSWQRQGSCGSRQCGFASSWTPRQKPGWRPWRRCSLQSSPGTVSDLQRVMLDTAFETRMCWPSCDRVTGIQSSLLILHVAAIVKRVHNIVFIILAIQPHGKEMKLVPSPLWPGEPDSRRHPADMLQLQHAAQDPWASGTPPPPDQNQQPSTDTGKDRSWTIHRAYQIFLAISAWQEEVSTETGKDKSIHRTQRVFFVNSKWQEDVIGPHVRYYY